MHVEYLPDFAVTETQDRALRDLLSTCFTKPQDIVFKTRRYFSEPPPHRWIVPGNNGALLAHIAVHDKQVQSGGRTYRIIGIAEVCVHPDGRGQGLVRLMLREIHAWATARGFDFGVLYGDPRFYSSSGYRNVDNFTHEEREADGRIVRKPAAVMVNPLGSTPWPTAPVHLPGPPF